MKNQGCLNLLFLPGRLRLAEAKAFGLLTLHFAKNAN
jgi:hypothetical protein